MSITISDDQPTTLTISGVSHPTFSETYIGTNGMGSSNYVFAPSSPTVLSIDDIRTYSPETGFESIRGEMVTVHMTIGNSLLEDKLIDKSKIKHELAVELAHKLLDGRYIEFTQRSDIATDNKIITARVFVTPDNTTQIIRKHQEK